MLGTPLQSLLQTPLSPSCRFLAPKSMYLACLRLSRSSTHASFTCTLTCVLYGHQKCSVSAAPLTFSEPVRLVSPFWWLASLSPQVSFDFILHKSLLLSPFFLFLINLKLILKICAATCPQRAGRWDRSHPDGLLDICSLVSQGFLGSLLIPDAGHCCCFVR